MNALILHGTGANHTSNWFSWLADQLKQQGWNVYLPDLPDAQTPEPAKYNPFLNKNLPFDLDDHTVLIGHSSGAVAALQYLQHIRPTEPVHATYLVSGFVTDLGWDALTKLFTPKLDYQLLQTLSEEFVLMHSEDDPYVPVSEAEELAEYLDATMILKKNEGHFNTEKSDSYREFPELLELILTG